jgi:3-dehydrosphinganine reductase
MDFRGRHVCITGGSSGIGLATAHLFAARGARLSLLARTPERLEAAADELRGAAGSSAVTTHPTDVSDRDAVNAAVAAAVAAHGPVDVLLTCAGVAHPGYFEQLDDAVFRETIDVDYFGTLWPIRAVVPDMIGRGRGSVVAVSSAAGLIGVFGYTAYGPSKFAVRGLMEALRQELKPHGIHVGCVYPPDVDTPQLAYENRYKPAETRAISGSIKPLTADAVAGSILEGIESGRFAIIPDAQTKLLARTAGLVPELFNLLFDRNIAKARRRRGQG